MISADTVQHLKLVREGSGYLGYKSNGNGFTQMWFSDLEECTQIVEKRSPSHDVWVSMAHYPSPAQSREAKYAQKLCSYWLDIDAHEGSQYQTIAEVESALETFIQKSGLVKPTIVHKTGYGVQCFWPLAQALPVSEWKPVALKLQILAQTLGLGIDPITADPARLLRVPGTLNFRNPDQPRLTSVDILSDELINCDIFSKSVDDATKKFPPIKKIPVPNTASSIPQNAKNLSIVKAMLAAIDPDPHPTGNRPRWRSCVWALASLGWGTVGCKLAKEWSKTGDLYDETDFDGVWNKFEEGRGTSVGNLVQYARENGYAGELFGAPQRGLIAIPASQIEPQPINWLLQDSIPLGAMVVVAGQPGMGKSQIALKLAAVATTGVGLPNGANFSDIGSVIVLANEDDAARTIRPRLDAVGADIEKVHIIQGVARNHDGLDYFRLDQDIQHLNALVAKLADVRLIIIDPPSAYLGAKIDAYKDSDVRRVLAPLGTLAQNTGALVLLVVHLNKRTDGNAQQRITGSTAWLAAPRAAFLAAEDAKTKNRYLLPVKNNLGNDKTGWQYEIREKLLPYTNLSIKAPHIEWLGESLLSASDILDKKATKPVSVVDEAKEFLEIELSAGPLMTNDIKARASQAGHSWASVIRAKSELPVRSIKPGTNWQWELQQ